ncbi:MAG TPA: SIR2 family protein [Caldilineaceae bacterium]|nr:SIR2 family protein [Caldilineaceae bacterium]
MLDRIGSAQPPNFNLPDEPHGVLADLPLPVYMTTNYDDFMVRGLSSRGKQPKRELFRWNSDLTKNYTSIFDTRADYQPTPAEPVVFHLHGHNEVPESLVLTEDDYLDFLVNLSSDRYRLPHWIERALTGSTLLFIGYSLADWNFRVLFRGLVRVREQSLRYGNFMVQVLPLPAEAPEEERQRVQRYLDKYFDEEKVRVYWGTATEFCQELRERATAEGVHRGS